ncbi:MAG: M43 family zinc metalloprotease [Owenweeksia sp.]
MKKITLFFATLLSCTLAFGQHNHKNGEWCATDQIKDVLINNNPDYAKRYEESRRMIEEGVASQSKQKKQAITYIIPVVFHVIYNDYRDNISRAQLEDGLRVLNEDFRRMNADASNTRSIFQGVAADIEVEFRLAKKDPQGNCTDGITRTQSSLSVNARDNVKGLVSWDNTKYFNVWVVNSINSQGSSGTVLGYAYLPVPGQPGSRDGMVIRHDRVGTIGTSSSVGRTFTHEAGHYLGLLHPFDGNSCFSGDGVSDTPPVAAPNFGCNPNSNSCSNDNPDLPDMIENYMDYADDNCQNVFTLGQKAIMRATLQNTNLRLNLRSSGNLTATGVNNPPACKPTAIFESERKVICAGESITFTDMSEDGDPTSWNWSFPGGSPSTSTQQNPTVTYPGPGYYDVALTVSNSAGLDSVTYSDLIYVKAVGSTTYYPNWSEDFEGSSIPVPDVNVIDGGDGISFQISTQAGSSGSQSISINNLNSTVIGEVDEVISPAITTIFTKNLSLSFSYAFAARQNDNTDELNVYASLDCGETWILRRFYKGAQLRTGANTTQPYVPASNEWTTQNINFNAYIGPDPLLIKFEFINGGGNNFYLDAINFSGEIGVEEYFSDQLQIFPNPAKDRFTIQTEQFELSGTLLTISDMTGKQIKRTVIDSNSNSYSVDARELGLTHGVYLIQLEKDGRVANKKLILE